MPDKTTAQILKVGQSVIVRTVTHHYTGRIVSVDERWLNLAEAAWIADSGRWAHALKTGELSEVEPFPDQVLVALGSDVDVSPWNHPLPRDVK